ncbi:MAG: hypothetical protein HN576_15955 [Bacteriovoracaceae bacterium]|jgi:hypothetical protein|nr:hypothetical protein [Bacteriovoracaceae bacterium]
MKKIILILSLILVLFSLTATASEIIVHDVIKDRLVKHGVIRIMVDDNQVSSDIVKMSINYNIKVKFLFFTKNLKGTKSIDFPSDYLTPYGYEDLEEQGSLRHEKVIVTHLGRVKISNHSGCHKIKIVPIKQRDWDGVFVYCQDIRSLGFARVRVNLKDIPVIGSHTVYSRLRE